MEPSVASDYPCSNGFNWAQLVKMQIVSDEWHHGHQILNFYPRDKDYRESPTARTMVAEQFGNAKPLDTDAELLKFGSDHVTLGGAFLEMGVCTGRTINFIAALNPGQRIWGFDSFDGLPERWTRTDMTVPQGTFRANVEGWTPPVLHNVALVKGMFHEPFLNSKSKS